ncbi:MAG: cytochrome c [Opitutaceae bacterium]|jgi:mono/diheme cytochrome c family protein
MSQVPSSDPRREAAAQSDDMLLKAHESIAAKPKVFGVCLAAGLIVILGLLLCCAGIYLDRFGGEFSVDVFNENAQAYPPRPKGPKAFDAVAFGKKQYISQCAACHHMTGIGVGLPGSYPPLVGSDWVLGSEERLIRIVLFGLTGKIEVSGKTYPGTLQMPAYGRVPGGGFNWRDNQISSVLTYVRQEWGNNAGPITTEKVVEIRSKENRSKPWTAEELIAIK